MLGEGKRLAGVRSPVGVAHAAGGTAPDRGQPVAAGLVPRSTRGQAGNASRADSRIETSATARRVLHAFSKTYLDGNARHAALADRVGQP